MCNWMHVTWIKVNEMRNMIMKAWDKAKTPKAFPTKFQFVTFEANTITSLFIMTQSIKEQLEEDQDVDPIIPISTIVEEMFARLYFLV